MKTERLHIRMEPDLWEWLRKKADAEMITVTAYVQDLLENARQNDSGKPNSWVKKTWEKAAQKLELDAPVAPRLPTSCPWCGGKMHIIPEEDWAACMSCRVGFDSTYRKLAQPCPSCGGELWRRAKGAVICRNCRKPFRTKKA